MSHTQSKTYDAVTEKYLDFSFEKTNSAYMLFYERRSPKSSPTTGLHKAGEEQPCCSDNGSSVSRTNNEETDKFIEAAADVTDNRNIVANDDETESNSDLSKCNFTAPIQCDIDNKCSGGDGGGDNEAIVSSSTTTSPLTTLCNHANSGGSSSHKTSLNALNIPLSATSFLSKELEEWIWQDNRHFLQDRNIFEHTYFK